MKKTFTVKLQVRVSMGKKPEGPGIFLILLEGSKQILMVQG